MKDFHAATHNTLRWAPQCVVTRDNKISKAAEALLLHPLSPLESRFAARSQKWRLARSTNAHPQCEARLSRVAPAFGFRGDGSMPKPEPPSVRDA
jgi:hypothetical protein